MGKTIIIIISVLVLALMARTSERAGEEINWRVISGGGCQGGTSANYQLSGTVAQTAVGWGNSTDYGLNHGYWVDFGGSGGPCDCEPGNANNDVTINIFDITYLISYLYKGGSAPAPYEICSGDPNGIDPCVCNIFDITYLISFLYKGGPVPIDCDTWLTNCGAPLR